MDKESSHPFMFKPAQSLGHPSIFPPPAVGKLPAAVQFIIPGLRVGAKDKENMYQLAKNCGPEIWQVEMGGAENTRTKEPATQVTFAFYVTPAETHEKNQQIIVATSRVLIERFLGPLSFFAGIKLSAVQQQATMSGQDGHFQKVLPVVGRTSVPPIRFEIPSELPLVSSEDIFSAFFWLRRGLAERDPLETFSAFMVCLQVLARCLVTTQPTVRCCKACGAEIEAQGPSNTSLVRELVISQLGATTELFEKLWRLRNATVAHGNRSITPEVFLELTELKFEAAMLAFRGIKLALGMPIDALPSPDQAFFVTDAFMYLD